MCVISTCVNTTSTKNPRVHKYMKYIKMTCSKDRVLKVILCTLVFHVLYVFYSMCVISTYVNITSTTNTSHRMYMKFHVCTVQLLSLYFMCSIRCALFQVLKIQEIMKYMEFMCVPCNYKRSTCYVIHVLCLFIRSYDSVCFLLCAMCGFLTCCNIISTWKTCNLQSKKVINED